MRNGFRRLRLAGTALIVAAALGTAVPGPALAAGAGPAHGRAPDPSAGLSWRSATPSPRGT